MLKLFELNSIRSRMVSGFLFLTLLILILAFVSLYTLDRTGRIAAIHGKISQLEVFTLSLIKADNDFLDLEIINEQYFKSRKSIYIHERDSLLALIGDGVKDVIVRSESKNYSLTDSLRSIDSTLELYNSIFNKLEELYFRKGFKGFGLEGEMRTHAHKLEETGSRVPITKILYLRRNEKDFFIRHDLQYHAAFNSIADKLLSDLNDGRRETETTLEHLRQYKKVFNSIVEIQKTIGLNGVSGLRSELNMLTRQLTNQYFNLAEYSSERSYQAQHNAEIFYIIMLCGALVFSILSGYWISKKLSEPIARLSKMMNTATATRSTEKIDVTFNNAAFEINDLTSSFLHLMERTNEQMKEIKTKSRLVKKRNKELKKLNAELDSFLYSTAHDLRSPLSSLLGLIDIAKHDNRQPALEGHFDMMETSINRMELFISQIVSYSKNKRLKPMPELINIHQLITAIFEDHRFVEGADQIEKTIKVAAMADFFSDRARVMILFNNLISNAIRYYDPAKSEPFIHINIVIDAREIMIEFKDNGVGIASEHLEKIYNMFYRANVNSKGSGLGLFIFKETLEKLKGTVSVHSEPGIGTTFLVKLPNFSGAPVSHQSMIAEMKVS